MRAWLAMSMLVLAAPLSLAEMACPERQFSAEELTAIVAAARENRPDIPPRYDDYRVRIERVRCLYIYLEYAVPDEPGRHVAFTIDPYGELMSFDVSESRAGAGQTEE